MTNRRIMWIALAFVILVQAGFVGVYHEMITGCCGGLLQAAQPDPPPPFAMWWVELAAYPMVHFLPIGRSHGGGFTITDWAHALIFAAINAVFWTVGTFLLLKALVLLCRVRGSAAGRLRLDDGPGAR
ncbi:MAG: hypothetical protein KY444_06830 [Gemmatimonadetes bacterium]|nr:hypothetical protein [Gemmatimonadota bacterium]